MGVPSRGTWYERLAMSVKDPQSPHPKSGSYEGTQSHVEGGDYLAKRTLKKGTAGWVLLAGLGVSYVISGDYSGWNLGLAEGGFGGLLIAAIIIAAKPTCGHRRSARVPASMSICVARNRQDVSAPITSSTMSNSPSRMTACGM